jgi:hypothetical protein
VVDQPETGFPNLRLWRLISQPDARRGTFGALRHRANEFSLDAAYAHAHALLRYYDIAEREVFPQKRSYLALNCFLFPYIS